jgi:hypothetical protein
MRKRKITEILKSESGASLLFTLAVTMLLIALGTSALVAASTSSGYLLRQREHSQVRLLQDSVHESIMRNLEAPDSGEFPILLNGDGNLGVLLVKEIYEIYEAEISDPSDLDSLFSGDGVLTVILPGADLYNENDDSDHLVFLNEVRLSLSVDKSDVWGNDPIPADPIDIEFTWIMFAELTVTVILETRSGRLLTSTAVYNCTNALLVSNGFGVMELQEDYSGWELIRFD